MMPKYTVFPTLLLLGLLAAAPALRAQCAASAVVTPVSCFGGSDGNILLSVSNASPVYTWSWSRNGTPQPPFTDPNPTVNIGSATAGTYVFTVTDALGCTAIATALIPQPTQLTLSTLPTPAGCLGSNSGAIDLSVSGGTPGYTYLWSDGQTTQDMGNLTAGTYCVTVTDASGCTASTCASIGQPPALALSYVATPLSCLGNNSGAIDLSVSGGTPGYTYQWSDGATTQDMSNLTAGTYCVTVTDQNGCTRTTCATITQPSSLNLSVSTIDIFCFGGGNGCIDLTVTGGTFGYTYLWSSGQKAQDLPSLQAGTYTVTVTDAKSCTQTISATVTQPTELWITATVTEADCGSSTGAIDIAVSGGTLPYLYAWSNGPSIPDLSGLSPGTYTLTVTDQQGCTRTWSVTLGMKLDIAVLPAPTCTPGATGSLDLTVSQGSGGYTFEWSNGAAQEDLSDLPPGVYTVTVTESLGCTATLSAAVSQPGILEVAAFALTPELCADQALAYIKLDVLSGHAPPYEVAWSNGSASGSRTGLPAEPLMINVPGAGQYTLTVTNAAGCSATATAVAVAKPALQLSTVETMVNCYAGATGAIDLSVTGGKPSFYYAWSNGWTTQDMSGLTAGTYTVTVTDVLGCAATASTTIAQPERLSASVQENFVTCFGGSNGQAEVTPKGGTPPYDYTWSNTTNTALIIGLGAGVYTVTLSDANGCTTTASAIITQPALSYTTDVLEVAAQVPSSNCSVSDGSLTLAEPAGSQAPYAFAWSNGSASGNGSGLVLSGLSAGFYQVTLTDAAGCTFTGGLAQGSPMLAVATPTPSTLCTASDGSIALSISGYTSTDFTYTWRRGGESESGAAASADFVIPNLPHGDYWVEVRDAAGCYAAVQARIEQGVSTLNAAATATATTCGQDNGIVVATVFGGQGPFTYQWSTGWSLATLARVPPGTYTVTVTEGGNGCTATASATVGGSTSTLASVTLTPVPLDCNKNEGNIVVNGTGIGPFNLKWFGSFTPGNVTTPTLPYTIPAYLANLYSVTVTDATGCSVVSGVEVPSSGAAVSVSISAMVPPSSCSSADGSMQVLISGGIAPFSYTWENGNLTGSGSGFSGPDMVISSLPSGSTVVTVTDAQGCRRFIYEHVPNAAPFQVNATAFAPSTCGAQDGYMEVEVTGAEGAFAYQLYRGYVLHSSGSSGTPSFTFTNLLAEQYRLIVASGQCTADLTGVIVPAAVMVMADFVTTPASCGGASGSIDLSVTGGHAPYRYDWANLPGTNDPQDLVNVKPGTYTVTITDLSGCTAAAAVELGGSSALYVYSDKTPASSCTSTDGSIILFTSGGLPPFKYDWAHLSGGDDPKYLTGLASGNYTVTVTDAAACTTTLSVQVLATQMQASASSLNTSCNGLPTGIISIDLSGASAVPPYTYAWVRVSGGGGNNGSGGSATEPVHITGLFSGGYSITVTNGEGCTRVLTASVAQGNGLSFQSAPIVQAVSCPGAADGSISITMTGGLLPYSYNWSGPAGFTSMQEDLSGLMTGVYRVTVTDGSGCIFNSLAILVDSPASISASVTASQAVTCFGGSNGSISIVVAGGQAPYGVQWSGPDGYTGSGTFLNGLKGGSYIPTVTDAKGCTYVRPPIILASPTEAPLLSASSCVNHALGNIGLSVSNMNLPLNVQWAGPNGYTATGNLITDLQPGLYTATATDAKGCTAVSAPIDASTTDVEIIISPKYFYINCELVIIDATVASPFGIMEYQWNTGDINPYLTAPTIPGTFTLTVTNVLCGISATDTIQVKPCGQLAGVVLLDNNKNCVDDGETPLTSWIVKAASTTTTYYGTSQTDGHYNILVEPGQLYTVSVVPQNPLWEPCLSSNTALVALPFDSVPGGDFLFKKQEECPMMEVYLSSGNLRRCFNNNLYKVHYCNFGTATATDAYVIVTLDAALTPLSSNLPFSPLGSNRYRFNLGSVGVGKCGDFHIYMSLDCNAPLGATHCSEAHIFPDTLCQPPSLQWSGASLRITSTCVGDSVQFTLKNVGIGDMPKGLEYIVIEDVVMMMKALVKLNAGDSVLVKVPARGSTWRMEVEQEPFHPGLSRPASWVEGCNGSTTFSTGMVNVYPPDDADKFIDVHCRENTAAYDPNDKQALPTGYGTAHYLSPNTPLEYLIRFQNTGNDTAFTVVLRDTLSPWLDPATVRPGAASHPYSWDLSGTGFLTFRFEHILLPDTATNPDASHGFVQYTIWPKEGVPLESEVLNRAGIYFDFNPPIITNQTWHTLGRNFMISSTWQPRQSDYRVLLQPNPASEEARLEVLGLPHDRGDCHLQVFDTQGHLVRDLYAPAPVFVLQVHGLPAGLYFFRVLADGDLVGNGKLAVER